MSDFGLIQSFDVDDGQLDEFRRNECFVLGYELCLIDEELKRPEPINRPIHSANQDRVRKSCEKSGREFKLTWPHDDSSEEWMHLEVSPL